MAKIKVEGVSYDNFTLHIKTKSPDAMKMAIEGKTGEYDISPAKKIRSLDANAYMWVLCDKLGEAMKMASIEVYRQAIKNAGLYRDLHIPEAEAATVRTAWEGLGKGWQTEQIDYTAEGNVIVRAYYGSSCYPTKNMARLIDDLVQDCEAIGIETRPREEVESLLSSWVPVNIKKN